jgi:hypothetical protein
MRTRTPYDATEPLDAHQALNRAPRHGDALTPEMAPDLPRAVDAPVRLPDAADVRTQACLALHADGAPRGIRLTSAVLAVAERRDLQHTADRLDAVRLPTRVDEGVRLRVGPSSSAWAK